MLAEAAACRGYSRCDDFLRNVHAHLAAGPNAVHLLLGDIPDAGAFDALVRLGAQESAVRRLIPSRQVAFLVSQGVKEAEALVTMTIPGAIDEVSFRAPDECVAFSGALLKLLHRMHTGRPAREKPVLRDISGS